MGAVGGVKVEEGHLARLVPVDGEVVGGEGQGHDGAVHGQTADLVTSDQVPHPESHVQAAGHHHVTQYCQSSHPPSVAATCLLSEMLNL